MAEDKAKYYNLTAPDGTKVRVKGETRRDTLLARGYKAGKGTADAEEKPSK
jgi:hypothetical protein